jgi:hypothetical protein
VHSVAAYAVLGQKASNFERGEVMRKKLRRGGVVALLLAVVGVSAAAASPSAARSSDDGHVEVIQLTAVDVQDTFLDLGDPGDSLGDQEVFSQDLFLQGAKVGMSGVVCTLVRLQPMVSATAQCLATVELHAGQITIQGLLTFTDGPSTFEVAITGGTGKYSTAHGVAIVEEGETEDRITLRIIS